MSAYDLELDESVAPGVAVSLSGELDLTNARELEERLCAAAPPGSFVVIDLNRVVFIDSAALHVLFKVARHVRPGSLGLVLEPDAPIARTLEIVGMRDAARIVSSREQLAQGSSA